MAAEYINDVELLDRLKNHDQKAFELLYLHSRNRLYVLAEYILKDKELARDITHEFFADFWANKLYIHIQSSLKSYLYNALRNRAISHLRGERMYSKVIDFVSGFEEMDMRYPLENNELKQSLNNAMGQLPPMAAKVFQLHYIEHFSHKEIAGRLRISRSTISSHIDRALKELRKELKKHI